MQIKLLVFKLHHLTRNIFILTYHTIPLEIKRLLHSDYYCPGTVLSTLQVLILIPTATLQIGTNRIIAHSIIM